VILRAALPGVDDVVRVAAPRALGGEGIVGPTAERFDALHPRCAQLCETFDPHRKSAKRNVGLCGVGGACGLR